MRRRDVIWALLGGGLAATLPFLVHAQQPMPTVGVVSVASPGTSRFPGFFLPQLNKFGWEDGRNCRVIFRWAEGRVDRFPALIDELVSEQVNVLVVFSEPGIQAAQRATTTIPIVATASDMVRNELAASVAKPGGNVTGINLVAEELNIKRLEILHEAVASARRIGTLVDPRLPRPKLETAAQLLGLDLIPVAARNPEEVTRGLDMLDSAQVDAVNVLDGPLMYAAHASIVERLIRIRLPAIYPWPEIAEKGGLLSYGSRLEVQFQQMARLVSRILGGARPEDLPIEQPDRYDLAVNLKTANTLGLTVSASILARADGVVE